MDRFGYACPQCSAGTVKKTTIKDYETKINNHIFVVPHAIVGICDGCHGVTVEPNDRKIWEGEFFKQIEKRRHLLPAQHITSIRNRLGLNPFEFAVLLGVYPRTLSNWEDPDRLTAQTSTIDILLRLIIDSIKTGKIDCLELLENQASELKIPIKINLKKRSKHD